MELVNLNLVNEHLAIFCIFNIAEIGTYWCCWLQYWKLSSKGMKKYSKLMQFASYLKIQ